MNAHKTPSPYKTVCGPWHEYRLEIRSLKNGRILLILETALPDSALPQIATRVRRRLDEAPIEKLTWVLRFRSGAPAETHYQHLGMKWDGERYYRPLRLAVFNQAAFSSAFE